MIKSIKLLALVGLLALGAPRAADAYYKEWLNRCSTGSLKTCASVKMWVQGTTVTLHIWNLSGSGTGADAYRGNVFYHIGLRNVPSAVVSATALMSMSGPNYSPTLIPAKWVVTNTNSSGAGGIDLRNATTGT